MIVKGFGGIGFFQGEIRSVIKKGPPFVVAKDGAPSTPLHVKGGPPVQTLACPLPIVSRQNLK